MPGYELSFLEIEKRVPFAVDVFDLKPEEAGQVKGEEQRKISQDAAFCRIEMQESIFDEVKQFGIGLRLLDTFLQQFDHEQGDGVLQYIEEDILIEDSPFEFTDTLEILQFVVIDDKIEDGRGLEEIGLARALAGTGPDAVDKIRLYAEQLGVDGDYETRFAVFHPPEDDSFGLV